MLEARVRCVWIRKSKGRIFNENVRQTQIAKPISVDQIIFTSWKCLRLLANFEYDHFYISQELEWQKYCLGNIPQSQTFTHLNHTSHLVRLAPTLPSLRPDIVLVCYVFNFHISSAFPFSCPLHPPTPSTVTMGRKFTGLQTLTISPPLSVIQTLDVFLFLISVCRGKRW